MALPFNPYQELLEEVGSDHSWTVRSERDILLAFLDDQGIDLEAFRCFVEAQAENELYDYVYDDTDDDDYSNTNEENE